MLSATALPVGATGGTGSVSLTVTPSTCTWTAASDSAWATVNPAIGTGSTVLTVTVAANADLTPRTATLTIAGSAYTVNQAAGIPLNLAGTWSGTYTMTAVHGGECVGDALGNPVGGSFGVPFAFVLAVQQGPTSLTATATDPGITLSSTYRGTAITTPPIPLYSDPATPTSFPYYCPNGLAREVQFGSQLGSGLINLTLTGDNSAVGTITANYLVRDAATHAIIETMIISATFAVAR